MVVPTYIIGEIIVKDNLNIENLMQTFENLLLQNYSTQFLDITIIKVCSNGGATYINSKLIAKANLNIASVMKTLKVLFSRIIGYCKHMVLGYV